MNMNIFFVRFKGKLVYHLVLKDHLKRFESGEDGVLTSLCGKKLSSSKLGYEIIDSTSTQYRFMLKRLSKCELCSETHKYIKHTGTVEQLKDYKTILQCLKAAIYKTNQDDRKQIWAITECILRLRVEYNNRRLMNEFKTFPIKIILNNSNQVNKCNMCSKSINNNSMFFIVTKPHNETEILCLRCMASSLHYMRAYKLPTYRYTHWNIIKDKAELRSDLPLEFEELGEGLV